MSFVAYGEEVLSAPRAGRATTSGAPIPTILPVPTLYPEHNYREEGLAELDRADGVLV